MSSRPLKAIDILRHELKALRFILDNYHAGRLEPAALPPREDFQSVQGRALYELILRAPSRAAAESQIGELELDEVDTDSFLHLSGEHYYTYPALVRERAEAIRRGELKVEAA
ncbi:MAG: hypothetical protein ACREQD_03445 [Candidatus Binataceae bacterium]